MTTDRPAAAACRPVAAAFFPDSKAKSLPRTPVPEPVIPKDLESDLAQKSMREVQKGWMNSFLDF